MREIKLTVRGDTVHASRHRAGIQGEANATALVVSFDESWDGYAKKITFWDALEQNPVEVTLGVNLLVDAANDTRTYKTTIPGEPLALYGECVLVIDGYADGARARSMSVRLAVDDAPMADHAGQPADPTPTQAEQLQVQIDGIIGDIQTVAQGVTEVREIAAAANEIAGKAAASANAAADHKNAAEAARNMAEGYTSHPPIIGENGNWMEWNGEAYVDTGKPSRGDTGPQGPDGKDGKPGADGVQGVPGADGHTPQKGVDYYTPEDKKEMVETIMALGSKVITPQMFGAKANGVDDDTAAVKAVLERGGNIFFPAGRYKVTEPLKATKPCKISMMKPYPSTFGGDYPLRADDNWMGARIETHASDKGVIGILVGDGVEIDGFYIRAMDSFGGTVRGEEGNVPQGSGTVFKYDGSQGVKTYPSQTRLAHIIVDCNSINTVPEVMFDFAPNKTYRCILDDITIGGIKVRQICDYGFRMLTPNAEDWTNSVVVRDLCVDALANYPVYIVGGGRGSGSWIFENLNIQTYPYPQNDKGYLCRDGHKCVATLKNMNYPFFLGGTIWDLHAATYETLFDTAGSTNIVSYGSDSFDEIDTVLKSKLKIASEDLYIKDLEMSVTADPDLGGNYLKLKDPHHNESGVFIPAATVGAEQIFAGVNQWFADYGAPTPTVGKNKLNPNAPDTEIGLHWGTDGSFHADTNFWTSNYIAVKLGDIVRVSKNSGATHSYYTTFFDKDKQFLYRVDTHFTGKGVTIDKVYCVDAEGSPLSFPDDVDYTKTAYVRLTWIPNHTPFEERESAKLCVTVNNADRSYEPYQVTLEGGLPSYLTFQSPNGTRYKLDVTDDGQVITQVVKD